MILCPHNPPPLTSHDSTPPADHFSTRINLVGVDWKPRLTLLPHRRGGGGGGWGNQRKENTVTKGKR